MAPRGRSAPLRSAPFRSAPAPHAAHRTAPPGLRRVSTFRGGQRDGGAPCFFMIIICHLFHRCFWSGGFSIAGTSYPQFLRANADPSLVPAVVSGMETSGPRCDRDVWTPSSGEEGRRESRLAWLPLETKPALRAAPGTGGLHHGTQHLGTIILTCTLGTPLPFEPSAPLPARLDPSSTHYLGALCFHHALWDPAPVGVVLIGAALTLLCLHATAWHRGGIPKPWQIIWGHCASQQAGEVSC